MKIVLLSIKDCQEFKEEKENNKKKKFKLIG